MPDSHADLVREAAEAIVGAEIARLRADYPDESSDGLRWLAVNRAVPAEREVEAVLAIAARHIEALIARTLDGADQDDGMGAHVGLARYARARADGMAAAVALLRGEAGRAG